MPRAWRDRPGPAIPRRYVVEPGKTLDGVWNVAADGGAYDLWVLGPNGYHRQFPGDLAQQAAAGMPEVQVCYELCDPPQVRVKLSESCRLLV